MASAGQGARQQQETARRRVEEAERQLAAARAREHAWAAGAVGEEQVANALTGLEQLGWVLMHDVAWPGRPRANLDHVLIGPGGVVVVDTKNWSGTVTVDPSRGLRSNGYRKTKEVDAVQAARHAVLTLLPTTAPDTVMGLICLAAQNQDLVRLAGGTVVVGRAQLRQHVMDLPTVLHTHAVTEAAESLGAALRHQPLARIPAQATRGAKPKGSPTTRRRKHRSGRANAMKLAVLALVIGGLVLFPEQITRTYMFVVTALFTPVAEDIGEDLQENMAPTPAP